MKRRSLLGLAAAAVAWVVAPFTARAQASKPQISWTRTEERLDLIIRGFDPSTSWFDQANDALARLSPSGALHQIDLAFVPMSRATAPEVEVSRRVRMYRNGSTHPWQAVVGLAWVEYESRVQDANPGYVPSGSWGLVVHVKTLPDEQTRRYYEGLSIEQPEGVKSYLGIW
jgi:hypothetical protein